MKKILIDVTNTLPVLGPNGGYISGIGRSTINLVNSLNKMDDLSLSIELYATTFRSMRCCFYDWKFKHHILPIPTKFKIKGRMMDSYLRYKLYDYDLFHITGNYFDVASNEPFVVTIHDCTDMDNKTNIDMDKALVEKLRKKYEYMAHYSKAIITVSEFSKREIVDYLNVDPDKIHVVYWGVDRGKFRKMPENLIIEILHKYDIYRPYFFACSCNRPRKNLVTALRAFKEFLKGNPQHVFVVAWNNPTPEIKEEFAKEIKDKHIIFLPFLTDDELVAFYNGASMSVYISIKEGFGLPILESFSCGTPVMTCRNSSLAEVGQNAAIYVGEYNIDEMVDVMKMFENQSYNLGEFYNLSEIVTRQFTWQNTAKKYLEIFEKSI